jgi:hypothetical protein
MAHSDRIFKFSKGIESVVKVLVITNLTRLTLQLHGLLSDSCIFSVYPIDTCSCWQGAAEGV